jgi:hypothetical protein
VKRAVFVFALLAGCAGPAALKRAWDAPDARFVDAWDAQARATTTLAYLAQAEFQARDRRESFTLEIFFAAPGDYLLRGRGTLGATGFRAHLRGDSLTLLLNRERRGFAGAVADYPDSSLREMWQLLRAGLPWLTGKADLHDPEAGEWHVQLCDRGRKPEVMAVETGARRLELEFGRFRDSYPFWHLTRAQGAAPDGRLSLVMRQRLYNPDFEAGLFRLELPPGTRPLTD